MTAISSRRQFVTTEWEESPQPASMFVQVQKTHGVVDPADHCYRRIIVGEQKNQDVYV